MAASGRPLRRALYRDYGARGAAHRDRCCHGSGYPGQLAMSMLIDNFGWLNNEAIPFSVSRFGAVVCLSIALFFIYSSSKLQPGEN